jgi:hypothetical protein
LPALIPPVNGPSSPVPHAVQTCLATSIAREPIRSPIYRLFWSDRRAFCSGCGSHSFAQFDPGLPTLAGSTATIPPRLACRGQPAPPAHIPDPQQSRV